MEIRLDQIGDRRFTWQETLEFPPDDLGRSDVLELSPVECQGSLTDTLSGLVLEVKLDYRQTLACGRCLGEVSEQRQERIDYLIEMSEAGADQEDEELSEEDLGILRLTRPILDTRSLVLEQIQLTIPMKPLCQEACAGLCPECGADLNAGACDCAPAVDPRWAALGALRQSGDGD